MPALASCEQLKPPNYTKWTLLPNSMPLGLHSFAMLVLLDSVYVFGGMMANGSMSKQTFTMDSASGTWMTVGTWWQY